MVMMRMMLVAVVRNRGFRTDLSKRVTVRGFNSFRVTVFSSPVSSSVTVSGLSLIHILESHVLKPEFGRFHEEEKAEFEKFELHFSKGAVLNQ